MESDRKKLQSLIVAAIKPVDRYQPAIDMAERMADEAGRDLVAFRMISHYLYLLQRKASMTNWSSRFEDHTAMPSAAVIERCAELGLRVELAEGHARTYRYISFGASDK